MSKKIRRQKPIKEGRTKESSTVNKRIEYAVAYTARKFNCSKSWVRNVAMGHFFGIKVDRYD